MNIVLIGSGNTATVVGKKLKVAGHTILQVAGRRLAAAEWLATQLEAAPVTSLSAISQVADLYLIAVADDAIAPVVRSLPLSGQTLVHTAASVSVQILKEKTANYGVLYPLQSLKKELAVLPSIPFLIDASNEATKNLLWSLAHTIGTGVAEANDAQRLKVHLAAVVVNNFTNHLFALTESYCREEGISFPLLFPLIQETVSRLSVLSPALVQTGPAIRGDRSTVEKHLAMLQGHPALRIIYRQLTESIGQTRQSGEAS